MWALLSKTPYVWNIWKDENKIPQKHEFQLHEFMLLNIVLMSGFSLIVMFTLSELGTKNPFWESKFMLLIYGMPLT